MEHLFIFGYARLDCVDPQTGGVVWTYQPPFLLTRDAPSDICRWMDRVIIGTEAHVLCVRMTDGAGLFAFRLPPLFRADRPLRVMAQGDLLIVHDRAALAAISLDGSIRWVTQFAKTERGRMPSVLWGENSRSGEMPTSFVRMGL